MTHKRKYGHRANWTSDMFYGRWCLTCYGEVKRGKKD